MHKIHVSYMTLSPLCHGGFDGADTGNAVVIRREPVVSLPGMPRIPCLSGNSIRGQVRRHIMRALFRAAGLGVGELPGRQWDLLYGALANGGHLTGTEKSPSPDGVRALRAELPPLSVLGAALYRYMIPGRARFGWAWPICRETVEGGLCTTGDGPLLPSGDIVTEVGVVRHIDRDQQDPEQTGVTPMPVTVEAIATGVELQQTIHLSREATAVEVGALAWGLSELEHLGGKSAGGLGAVRVIHDGDAAPYAAWLDDVGPDTLRARLVALAETLS